MNDKKMYEEMSKLNELVLHKGIVPSFEEIINQLEKQKEVLDKIKEILKDYGDKEDISSITMYYISGESLIHILELLEEIE